MGERIRQLAWAAAAVLLSACSTSVGHIYSAYQDLPERRARIDCGGDYAVYDDAKADRILVISNPYLEARNAVCGTGEPLPARSRRVAEAFLATDPKRPDCVATGSTALTDLHYEVQYTCSGPAPSPSKPSSKPKS